MGTCKHMPGFVWEVIRRSKDGVKFPQLWHQSLGLPSQKNKEPQGLSACTSSLGLFSVRSVFCLFFINAVDWRHWNVLLKKCCCWICGSNFNTDRRRLSCGIYALYLWTCISIFSLYVRSLIISVYYCCGVLSLCYQAFILCLPSRYPICPKPFSPSILWLLVTQPLYDVKTPTFVSSWYPLPPHPYVYMQTNKHTHAHTPLYLSNRKKQGVNLWVVW